MNHAIYDAVAERAAGRCEQCAHPFADTLNDRPECDHCFGRARSESVETCWLLCGNCHRAKSAGDPSAGYWLIRYAIFCRRHSYLEVLDRALRDLEFKTVKEALST